MMCHKAKLFWIKILFFQVLTGSSQELKRTILCESNKINAVLFLEQDSSLVFSAEGYLNKFDLTNPKGEIKKVKVSNASVTSVQKSINEQLLTATSYRSVALIDVKKFKKIRENKKAHLRFSKGGSFSNDQTQIVTTSWSDNTLASWTLPDLKLKLRFNDSIWTDQAIFIQNDKYLASINHANTIKIWDPQSGALLRVLSGHKDWVMAICENKSTNQIITAGMDQNILVWDIKTGTAVDSISQAHQRGVTTLSLSQNGRYLISGGLDKCVKIWDTSDLSLVYTIPLKFDVLSVGIHNLSNTIAVAGLSNEIEIWDLGKICNFTN